MISEDLPRFQVVAAGGPVAFMDVLAPPYHSSDRDCIYYNVLPNDGGLPGEKCFLLEIPPPDDFWCSSLSYGGPTIEED